MTQPNPFVEPRFPNIPPFSLMPEPAEDEAPESEESSPFPEPPDDGGPKDGGDGGGQ